MIGRAPAFWSRPGSLAGGLLSPVGRVVGHITLGRMREPGIAVPVPVLCVGNPTVGGSGKTPTVILVLERLLARGARPFALLRGHGGQLPGPVRVDPAVHDARAVGDEALLLAAVAPTIVSRDRVAGARLAVDAGATHIVMDDGFQNPALAKDVSLLVIDGGAGVGNGQVLPAGPLRAPLAPQIGLADAILVLGPGAPGAAVGALADAMGKAVLQGAVVPDLDAIAALRGHRVLAFAGIGRPDKLAASLTSEGVEVVRLRAFPDHHPYEVSEIAALIAEADAAQLTVVTTAKDLVRLQGPAFAPWRDRLRVLPVRVMLSDPARLDALLTLLDARAMARGL